MLGLSVLGQSGSPFEPPGSGKPKSTPKIAPVARNSISNSPIASEVEMRGYFKLGDDYFFSIHQKKVDPNSKSKNKKSEWRKKGEDAFGQYRVKDFDPDKEELTLERNGRTENITLHVSQLDMRPPGSKSPRGSLSLPRPVTRKVMPPKPRATPPLPAALSQSSSSNPVQPPPIRSSAEGSARNGPSSSSSSPGFVQRPFIPRRQTGLPRPPASPESPTIGGSTEGSGSSPGNSNATNPGFNMPFSQVKRISSGGGSPNGEIDLSNLPPPPPPPNILPPGPPPDIEPSLQDR